MYYKISTYDANLFGKVLTVAIRGLKNRTILDTLNVL
jgi:hypothetical protein